jgi:hypothetical protein
VVVDASHPSRPKRIGSVRVEGAGDANDSATDGVGAQLPYVYLSAPNAGVDEIGASDATQPLDVARGSVPVRAGRLEVRGVRTCLFDADTGLIVFRSPF